MKYAKMQGCLPSDQQTAKASRIVKLRVIGKLCHNNLVLVHSINDCLPELRSVVLGVLSLSILLA
jgi:hypothetical protein